MVITITASSTTVTTRAGARLTAVLAILVIGDSDDDEDKALGVVPLLRDDGGGDDGDGGEGDGVTVSMAGRPRVATMKMTRIFEAAPMM